jgi:hypothetical protein
MGLSIIQPLDSNRSNPAKSAALLCFVIAAGLLAASLFSASPARAGGKAVTHTVSSIR